MSSKKPSERTITEDCRVYSCRMCRKMLFTSNDFLPHDSTKNAKGHKKFKFQAYGYDEQKSVCTSLFLDPDLAPWVAKESRDTQALRLNEMEKAKVALEDEEIYGPGGRPKTPPMSEEQLAALMATDDTETKKNTTVADDDSDEEITDSDAKMPAKNTKSTTKTSVTSVPAKSTSVSVSQPPNKAMVKTAEEDSDEEILDDDDDRFGDDFADDDFDDDDDFKSVSGAGGGGHNAARRKEFTIAKAAIDIVDPDTIYCKHCKCKVGAQSWTGSQCSCGAWVTPSFKIHAKAVDEIPGSLYLRLYKQ